jgi:hypothetical protein
MRLHPEVTEDEAYAWLKEQAERDDPTDWTEEMETNLRMFAKAMAAICHADVPDELVPLFP